MTFFQTNKKAGEPLGPPTHFLAYNLRFHCFFDSNCASNRHTNHGVVTSTDQAHHFYA